MASPNTGIFASSFVEGFLGQRKDQEERNQRNKIIKLQAKLIEQQLAAGKVKLDAQTKLSDLLTGSVGEFEQVGEIAPTPSGSPLGEDGRKPIPQFESTGQEPMGLLEMLSDPEGFAALIQSGQVKIGDLIGKPQQDTTLSRNIEATGAARGTELFQERMLTALSSDQNDEVLAQIVLGQQQEKLVEQRRERELLERTEGEAKIGRAQAIRNDFSNAKRIIELQTDLANTFAAAGIPFGEAIREGAAGLNAIFGALGFDVSKSTEIIAKRDELIKLFADGTLEAIDRFKGTGTITNQKFDALVAASPEIGKSALANARVLAARMQAALDAAARKSEIIPNRKEIEAWIAEMKRGPITKATERAKAGAETASAFAKRQFEAAQTGLGNVQDLFNTTVDRARPRASAASEFINKKIDELRQVDFSQLSEEAQAETFKLLSVAGERAQAGFDTAVEKAQPGLGAVQDLFQTGVERAKPVVAGAVDSARTSAATASEFTSRKLEELRQVDYDALSDEAKAEIFGLLNAARDTAQAGVERAKPVVTSGIEQAQAAAKAVIDRLQAIDFKGMSKEAKQRALDELSQIDPKQLSADAKAKAIDLYDEIYHAINK